MMLRRPLLTCIAFLLAAGQAHACGGWLPPDRLQARHGAILGLGDGTFAFEAARLAPPDDRRPPPAEYRDPDGPSLGTAAQAQVRQLRAQPDLAAARAIATPDLVAADRAYTLGAVAWNDGARDDAGQLFAAVLELPAGERGQRAIAAAWMLARLATDDGRWHEADLWFTEVRALRLAGAPDPLGLYWTSLGEEARNALARADYGRAVALYARQAANGERAGVESLLLVARRLVSNQDQYDLALPDPMVQRLLAVYFFSRGGEWLEDYPEHGIRASDAASEPAQIAQLLRAVRAQGPAAFEGADRMAAVAYRAGQWALAAELIALSGRSPLAQWIDGKLKLRIGDRAGAEAALAAASRAFPPDEIWSDDVWYGGEYVPKPVCDLAAERGLLRLVQSDYYAAAELLLQAGEDYWTELAYVAERVLDLDQLEALVAAHPLPHTRPNGYDKDRRNLQDRSVVRLHDLAARRLLRAGRDAAALALVTDPALRGHATRYAQARQRARQAREPIDAAQAWFAAAGVLREHGGDLLGRDSWVDPQEIPDPPDRPASELWRRQQVAEPPPFDGQDGTRYMAVAHLERAAALLPARSQAFAAVLCRATAWTIHYDPPIGRAWYARYLAEGAWVPWGTLFGRGPSDGSACPLPDFGKARREHQIAVLRKAWHGVRPWLLPGLALAAFTLWLVARRRIRTTPAHRSAHPSHQ